MARGLKDWVEAYCEYTENTESHPLFNKWVAYSVISAALRKKVRFDLGRISIFPNLYVVLVAEPGVARKSQAISYGRQLIKAVPEIQTTADAITREALLEEFAGAATDDVMPNGTLLRHSSLSIISTEFETFLGQKSDNTKMLVLLTEFFDCGEDPFKYRTKTRGETVIPSLYLSILGATTPESLASSLPTIAIGGGLTSRIIFVYATGKSKKVPIPVVTPEMKRIKELLIKDLFVINRLAGRYSFDSLARDFWINWYTNYEPNTPGRLCPENTFNGWYSRKHIFICKLCQIIAASRHDSSLEITVPILEQAVQDVEEVELHMGKVFSAVGKSVVTSEVDTVLNIIKQYKSISENQLLQIVWRDIDSDKFDNVIKTAIRTGKVQRSYEGPTGKPEIWYNWREKE